MEALQRVDDEAGLAAALERLGTRLPSSTSETVQSVLAAVRSHLGMEVAFLSEFADGRRVVRFVDAPDDGRLAAGCSDPLEETYCQRIVDGRLPALITDSAADPAAAGLGLTRTLGIGSYVGVPIRFSNGTVYGTFCCFRSAPNSTLNDRDVALMRVLATLLADRIEHDVLEREAAETRSIRVRQLLHDRGIRTVVQPIVRLADGSVAGHEALSRLDGGKRGPDAWLREATEVGLGAELERAMLALALDRLDERPAGTYLAFNVSPGTLTAQDTLAMLSGRRLEGVVIELTEHAVVDDYASLLAALAGLRQAGARIAVDDAGAGFASLTHILQLQPDLIKLDMSLTSLVSRDLVRQALVEALVYFAQRCGSRLVAEGVESGEDAAKLLELGVECAQGYHFGRPAPQFRSATVAIVRPARPGAS